jgi:hypothetical protein
MPLWIVTWLLLLLAGLVVNSGCASKPKPNWDQRVGIYTFDEAVLELGPPVSSTILQDGTHVAEWFLGYGSQMTFGFGTGFYGHGGGVSVGQTVAAPAPGRYLRLVFGPEGELQRWEKFKR